MSDEELALKIAQNVAQAGGKAFYVGGYVRNQLIHEKPADIDIEIYGVPYKTLENILSPLCKFSFVGQNFGVHKIHGHNIDISLEPSVDIQNAMKKSAERRDFTINAIFENILTGERHDFFNSRDDILSRTIKTINDKVFETDPVRVLRAARLSVCSGFHIHPDTMALAQQISLKNIPQERIFDELKKVLLRADKPSQFFIYLIKMQQLDIWFPELKALIGAVQNQKVHQTNDVWTHTMLVLDEATAVRNTAEFPLGFMLAALCHDMGKPLCVETDTKGIVHNHKHELEGLAPVQTFLHRLTTQKDIIKYVMNMTEKHGEPLQKANTCSHWTKTNRMFDSSVSPSDLVKLAICDYKGCNPIDRRYKNPEKYLTKRLAQYQELLKQPAVTGQDLIDAGVPQNRLLGQALAHAHTLYLNGMDKDTALKHTLGFIKGKLNDKNNISSDR